MPVQAAAAEAAKLCPNGIDVLINNAGGLQSGNGYGLNSCVSIPKNPCHAACFPCRCCWGIHKGITNVRSLLLLQRCSCKHCSCTYVEDLRLGSLLPMAHARW